MISARQPIVGVVPGSKRTPFPLTASGNGRYLLDKYGNPFPIIGDSGQLICTLSPSEIAYYLDTRKAQGFNSVLVSLSHHNLPAQRGAPANYNGDYPFTTKIGGGAYVGTAGTADFSTPNNTYFSYVDAMFAAMYARQMFALTYVQSWGFNLDLWWPDLTASANTRAVCTTLGNYLGARYASLTNVIWMFGSDSVGNTTGSPESGISRSHAVMTGMIAAGATQWRTGDWFAPSEASDGPADAGAGVAFKDYMSLNGSYTYGGTFPGGNPGDSHVYLEARRGYSFTPTVATQGQTGAVPPHIPCFLKESAYFGATGSQGDGTSAGLRAGRAWSVLSGCTEGYFYGHLNVYCFGAGWPTDLQHVSALDMKRWAAFIARFSWWKLIPSELAGMRLLVVTSNGVQTIGDNYVASACADDGTLLLAYAPTYGGSTQTFQLDLRSMAGNSRADWWDPTNGAFTPITGGAFTLANSLSAQSFTVPGLNSAGDSDWMLVVRTTP